MNEGSTIPDGNGTDKADPSMGPEFTRTVGEDKNTMADLIKDSQGLQKEINTIFAELSDINRQVRIDIDEFCRIGLHNTSSILNNSRLE